MKGILGRKVGMTQVFTKNGKLIPVTVVEVEPNVVMQVKTVENNGYNAIQLGVFEKKEKNATRAEIGNAKKANTTPKRFLKEIRDYEGSYNVGDAVSVDVFASGEVVDVTGTTKGKGFQGVIKRHNQSRGPMGHGSHYHRRPGSLGTMLPKRVLKGKNLPGHMGVETVTIQNLEVIEVNPSENYMLISGNVPGAKNSLVLIKTAAKGLKPRAAEELVEYETAEAVVDEVVEETPATEEVVEETPATEEVVEETETPVEETAEETSEEVSEEENTNEDAKEEEDK